MSDPAIPPEISAKYALRGTLGRGASGVVLDAFDRLIQRRVAIKLVQLPPRGEAEAAETHQRFRREAQAAGRLSHPGIVAVYDYGENDGQAWIVMERVGGGTLKALLDSGVRLPVAEASRIAIQVLEALAYSHARGVVHRDIKPANIMLDDAEDSAAPRVKITDFGISRLEDSAITRLGTVLGTPSSMAPEQLRGEPADHRADIWAAGTVLYQLLTGEKAFAGGFQAVMHKVLHTEPVAPSLLSDSLPRGFDAVLARALAKRPQDRFQSASDFAHAVAEAARETPPPAFAGAGPLPGLEEDATLLRPAPAAGAGPAAPATAPAPAARRRRPAWLPALALLALAGGGAGAWWLWPRGDAPPLTSRTETAQATGQAGTSGPAPERPAEGEGAAAPDAAPPAAGEPPPAGAGAPAPGPGASEAPPAGPPQGQGSAAPPGAGERPAPEAGDAPERQEQPASPGAAGDRPAAPPPDNTPPSPQGPGQDGGPAGAPAPSPAPDTARPDAPAEPPPAETTRPPKKHPAEAGEAGRPEDTGRPPPERETPAGEARPRETPPPPRPPEAPEAPPREAAPAQPGPAQPDLPPAPALTPGGWMPEGRPGLDAEPAPGPATPPAAGGAAPRPSPAPPGLAAPDPAPPGRPGGAPPASPPAPPSGAAGVAAAMRQALSASSCALVSGSAGEQGGVLSGAVRQGEAAILAAALQRAGLPAGAVRLELQEFNGPYCALVPVLAPFLASPGAAPAVRRDGGTPLLAGDLLRLDIAMPQAPSYLELLYLTTDGQVVQLAPPEAQAAGARLRKGDPGPGFPGWVLEEPYGTDLLLVVTSDRPVFPAGRAVVQPLAEFLAMAREALPRLRQQGGRAEIRPLVVTVAPRR